MKIIFPTPKNKLSDVNKTIINIGNGQKFTNVGFWRVAIALYGPKKGSVMIQMLICTQMV